MNAHHIALRPAAITRVLAAMVCFLAIAHAAGQVTKYWAGYPTVFGLVPLFDLNSEQSIPTFFSSAQLLFASVLLGVVATLKQRSRAPYGRQWAVLATAFLYMAFDEAAGIHEWLTYPVQDLLGDRASGFFYFAWVVPGMVVAILFALWFLGFFLHLPAKTRLPVFVAAALFIGGAIGVELIEGRHVDLHGSDNLTYGMLVMLEETCELAGITLFIHALLKYIEECGGVGLVLSEP